jgi:hypothetical protein
VKTVHEARTYCKNRFAALRKSWLADRAATDWPLEFGLGVPTEKEALSDFGAVKAWVAMWRDQPGLQLIERAWRTVGAQRLPEKVVLHSPEEVASWAGERKRWDTAKRRYEYLVTRWPALAGHANRHFDELADYEDLDFERLSSMLGWLSVHRESGLYARQLPIAGMHTKWLEARQGLIGDLAGAILGKPGVADFYAATGLKPLPDVVRFRLLDPAVRARCFGIGDMTVPVADLAAADLPVTTVIVVENMVTGASFSDREGTAVILGRGYGVDVLSKIGWLSSRRVLYWGDIDTHGLSILSRARAHLPHLESALMDQEVLDHHMALGLVGVEAKPSRAESLPNLTLVEQQLYEKLRKPDGTAHRLEQEQIGWDWAMERLGAG